MNMNVTAKEPIPVCIKLCEPICARSDYTIGINIFDNPFASITVRGLTKSARAAMSRLTTRILSILSV